jgi:hypothetical protein
MRKLIFWLAVAPGAGFLPEMILSKTTAMVYNTKSSSSGIAGGHVFAPAGDQLII